jgi:hypothetical protein
MKITTSLLLTAVAALAFVSVSPEAAAQSTISFEFGSRTVPYSPPGSSTITYDVPLFDSALGTLTGATLTLYEGFRVDLQLQNPTAGTGYAAYLFDSYPQWYSDDLPGFFYNSLGSEISGAITVAAGETFSDSYFFDDEHVESLSGLLSSLTSTGGETFSLSYDGFLRPEPKDLSDGLVPSDTRNYFSQGTISYTYTPVPEPSAMALVLGGGVLALVRRKRRA